MNLVNEGDDIITILCVDEGAENNEYPAERRRWEWSEGQTKLLINLYQQNFKKVGKNKQFATFHKLFAFISEEMKNYGHEVSAIQVKTKWDSLSRAYKDTVVNNNKTGAKRRTCQFEEELHQIFKKKRNVYPEILVDASNTLIPEESEGSKLCHPINQLLDEAATSHEPMSNKTIPKKDKMRLRKSALDIHVEMRERHHKEKLNLLRELNLEKMQLKEKIEEQKAKDRAELLKILSGKTKQIEDD